MQGTQSKRYQTRSRSRLCQSSENLLAPFSWMKTRWVFLNPTSLSLALNHIHLLRHSGASRTTSSIHASIVKNAELHDSDNLDLLCNIILIWNSLLSVYSKQGFNGLSEAGKLFEEMPVRDTVSWNTMISGFIRNGQLDVGFKHFNRMRESGIHRFDQASLTTVLSGLNGSDFLCASKMVHCLVLRSGYDGEITVGNSLVTSYFKCGCSSSGRRVFNEMFARNVVTWTALISGLVQNDLYEQSFRVFVTMRRETVPPNSLTFLSSLMACSGLQALNEGRQIHGLLWKMGIDSDLHVESALMDMYSKCGSVEDAWRIFDSAKELDEVAVTIMLMGFVQNGFEEEAIQIFKKMVKSEKLEIDANVVSAILGVFGNDTSLGLGKQIHGLIFKKRLTCNVYVGNGLINMYSKCGEFDQSIQVFDEMPQRNSVSWNSAIAAFARHGYGFGALELYERMRLEGVEPTDVTFLSLLHACSHMGLIQMGMAFLNSMSEDHKMSPRAEHYACIVDMLGRAGLLKEAKCFIEALPEKRFMSALVWQALLGACSFHAESELGKFAAERLFEADPKSSASYVLLANIYSSKGKWKERARTIKRMKERGVSKETGVSWIEVEKKVHSFVVRDNLHPQGEAIYGVLAELLEAMADEGYVPEKRFVLHYCNQDGNI